MKIEILNRWSAQVIFTAEIPDDTPERFRVRAAVVMAVEQRANLSAADLRAANLRDANLRDANLRDANLRAANLSDANLSAAKNLTYEQLIPIRDDLWAVLSSAPREADGLRQALVDGRVDGSTYHGECACLVGTIANIRKSAVDDLGALKPNSSRPIERWFMGIRKGDTPDKNTCAKFALQWTDEWLFAVREAFAK